MDVEELDSRLFITVKEFADLAQINPRTVRRGIELGEIPAVKFSGTVRIPVPGVRALLGLPEKVQAGAA